MTPSVQIPLLEVLAIILQTVPELLALPHRLRECRARTSRAGPVSALRILAELALESQKGKLFGQLWLSSDRNTELAELAEFVSWL